MEGEATAPEIRARAYLLVRNGPPIWVVEGVGQVSEELSLATGDELIEFTTLATLGDARQPTFEPVSFWVERGVIYGFGAISKAKWKDHLADLRKSALGAPAMPGLVVSG